MQNIPSKDPKLFSNEQEYNGFIGNLEDGNLNNLNRIKENITFLRRSVELLNPTNHVYHSHMRLMYHRHRITGSTTAFGEFLANLIPSV